jgi:LPXTG-motif cell wall-anchored protein
VQTALGLNPVSAFATAGSTAAGSIPPLLESVAAALPPVVETPRAAAAVPSADLPRTGVAAGSMAASALAALLFGLGLRRFGRRRNLAG